MAVTQAKDVTLNDTDAIVLGKSSIGNDLTVTAGGRSPTQVVRCQSLRLRRSPLLSDITLDKAHNFATVVISAANNVTLNDTNAIVLGKSSIGNDLGDGEWQCHAVGRFDGR